MTETMYTVHVTPRYEDLEYDAVIYKAIKGGINGPWGEETFTTLADVEDWITREGFVRTTAYGELCANGFATADLKVKGK